MDAPTITDQNEAYDTNGSRWVQMIVCEQCCENVMPVEKWKELLKRQEHKRGALYYNCPNCGNVRVTHDDLNTRWIQLEID
jgi:uncharacterized Zn finger protein